MSTWLMATPLFKMLATPKAKPLLEWCKANEPSLFISAASLSEIALGITSYRDPSRTAPAPSATGSRDHYALPRPHPPSRRRHRQARRRALAGPQVSRALGFNDALLLATAQLRGHGLITRRDEIVWPLGESSDCDGLGSTGQCEFVSAGMQGEARGGLPDQSEDRLCSRM
jgi:predicted nucleic acid-binding protein